MFKGPSKNGIIEVYESNIINNKALYLGIGVKKTDLTGEELCQTQFKEKFSNYLELLYKGAYFVFKKFKGEEVELEIIREKFYTIECDKKHKIFDLDEGERCLFKLERLCETSQD